MSVHVAEDITLKLAEHRLDWGRIDKRIKAALNEEGGGGSPEHHLGPFVAVARMAGTDGEAFARRLGEALGWTTLGGEIVDMIAETFELDEAALHALDEAQLNWVRETLGDLMPHQVINRDTYIHYLGKVVRMIGLHGNVVLIGRGSHLFLPRGQGLSLRLVAPVADRVARIAVRENLSDAAAMKRIHDEDRRRAEFVEHYFGHSVDDPALYDLVLNRSTLSDDEMVDAALAVCRRRGFHA